jgi:hypothetical protein
MQQDQLPMVIGAAVMVCLALAVVIWELHPASVPATPNRCYFYDTANGNVIIEPNGTIPPMKGANGGETLVLAKFFSCTGCGDKKLGYLLKYNAKAKAAAEALTHQSSGNLSPSQSMQFNSSLAKYQIAIASGTLVRRPAKGSHWYLLASVAGSKIARLPRCSATALANACLP